MSQVGTIVLDFCAITNPGLLFESLLVFRQAAFRIAVAESNLTPIDIIWLANPTNTVDLRDPDLIRLLANEFDTTSLSLGADNLPLAVSLLQQAIDEGYVAVEPALARNDPIHETLKKLKLPPGVFNVYSGGPYGMITVAPQSPETIYNDFAIAVRRNYQLATGHPSLLRATKDPLLKRRLFTKVGEGTFSQALRVWRPSSIAEIRAAIDNPSLLPTIVDAVERVANEAAYREELKVFLPNYVLDTITGGFASLFQMLWKVYRHNRQLRDKH